MRPWAWVFLVVSCSVAIAAAQPRVEVEGEGPERRYVHHFGDQSWVYASQADRDRTRAFMRGEAERRVAHPRPVALAMTDAERAAQDAQLPWAAAYARTCRRFHRAAADPRAAQREAEAGARIARGTTTGDDHGPPLPFVDDAHPGHPLARVRARFVVTLAGGSPSLALPHLELGSHELTTYPDGGAYALAPDHPLIAALSRFDDGDCVLVTGHVLGPYTTGHLDHDPEQMACGRSFWTRIDAIEACGAP